jgi:hypothetical protein
MPDEIDLATGRRGPGPAPSGDVPRHTTRAVGQPVIAKLLRSIPRGATAIFVGVGLLASANAASASLIGAQVTYRSLFPNTQSVLDAGGTQTVTPLTTFADTKNGLSSFFIGNKLVVENTSPLAFAAGTFNGPQLSFGGGGLTGATVDPLSSADFIGGVSSTASTLLTNFQALTPALGSTMTVDLASNGTLTGQQVGYQYLVPTTASLQEDLGTSTLGMGTYFVDGADGITVVVGANTITVINDVPLQFAVGAFNGPNLVFSGVNIVSAAIDPISAADFLGTVSTTPDSIDINFSGLVPALGHAVVIDVVSTVPEPGSALLLVLAIAGLAWVHQWHRQKSQQPEPV